MRVVLVHPAGSNWVPGKRDITATANRMAPLGLLSIAAHLEGQGHDVFVHDCLGPKAPPDIDSNISAILARNPDLIGISATTSGFLDGYEIASRIKSIRPQVMTIFGGVHISAMGATLLDQFGDIDFLCIGEGEITISELAAGRDPRLINGLVWKDGDKPVKNPARAQIPDLDSLPFPAYQKLAGFPKGYNLPLFSYIMTPGATMITSRGCLYQCSYCDRSVFKHGFRYNSAEYVYEHMRYLKTDFGVRHINIYDDLFTTNRERISGLCEKLISMPLAMQFNCAVRVGHVDDELLKMLKAAGCLQVSLGIETGDPSLIKVHKSGVTLQKVEETVRLIQAHGLRAKGLFMMGLPGDTEESIRRTSDFVMSLDLDDMNMSKFTPFPGAPVWPTIKEQGSFDNDWRKMNCLNFVFVPKGVASRETLDHLYNQHVKRFYSGRAWRTKFRSRLWEHRKSLIYMLRHLSTFLEARRNFEPDLCEKTI
ncbi:Radical SAM domain protein [uncultured Desulfobacterium sp.]|uniref:Radical SAM domain protein n=1 Tax=uncultured Desulfobacterium sp. TaxID=201089 RepID=A0A445N329_9BACT|nr:Radical SAM domain protein [uncultured Desulfobacterium sp.]